MAEPSFRELFALRDQSGAEIVDRYAAFTQDRFNYQDGVPLVVGTYNGEDVPFLLAALGRSDMLVAPIVVDNKPGQNAAADFAERMGARVIEQPIPGQLSALRTGLQYAEDHFPGRPVLITDDDCLPPRAWVRTMVDHAGFTRETGGIAFGGVVLEHGPSFAADALRTVYAFGGDIARRALRATPKARGPSVVAHLDAKGMILENMQNEDPAAFPTDVRFRDCVQAAGGEVKSILLPGAVMFTRGDRFESVRKLAIDVVQRGRKRAELYRGEN